MLIIFKEYLMLMAFFFTADYVATKAMPQGCCDDPNDSCCSGGRGPPVGAGGPPRGAGGPPRGAGGPPPPGSPPGGMSQGQQTTSGYPSTSYYNISIPATIFIQYNTSSLSGTRPPPPKATVPLKPTAAVPIMFNPNATALNGYLPNVTLPNGLLPNVTIPNSLLPNGMAPKGIPRSV